VEAREFQERLRRTGAYDTPASPRRARCDRLLGRLDAWYYYHLLRIVVDCARVSRRGLLDAASWSVFSFRALRLVEAVGGRVSVAGFRRAAAVPSPVVYVANHMSLLETFAIPVMAMARGRHLTIVLKESLLRYPYFGRVLAAIRPVTVSRRNPREDLKRVLEGTTASLANGDDVLIFPQSTRTTQVDAADFNSLASKVARRAGVPLVPLALKTDFHGIGRVVRDVGPVDRSRPVLFRFGDPIRITGTGQQEHRRVVAFIVETLREWRDSGATRAAAGT